MRRRGLIAALGVLASLAGQVSLAFAGHDTLSALLPGSPLVGSRLFAEKGCLGCHGVHGEGGTAGPDLGRGTLNRPLFEIAAVMWNHAPGMEHLFQEKRVRRPTFEPPEMASLLAFLYYLGSLDPPGDAEKGALLFHQKGCQTCHALGGKGGRVGPDLTSYGRYASPLFLTTALWNRGKAMAAAMEARNVPRPSFQGSDIPDLPESILSEAFRSLDDHDAVLGPARDGGYYLIGFRRDTFVPDVFRGIEWSTDRVFAETRRKLEQATRSVYLLPEWSDVDTPEDLRDLKERNEGTAFAKSRTMKYLFATGVAEGTEQC